MATRDAFYKRVLDEVTEGKSIPTAPNKERLKSITDNALRRFWEYDDEAVEFEYIVVSQTIKSSQLYRERRQVQLPKCVEAVINVRETGTGFYSMNINPDYRKTNFNLHNFIMGDSDTMLFSVVASSYQDFMRNFYLNTVAYSFNPHSTMLTIEGRDTFRDLILDAYVHIHEDSMFEMDRFFRYVCGQCRISFSRIFGLIDAKILGGLSLNLDDMKEDGKDAIAEVKEEWDKQKEAADFWVDD